MKRYLITATISTDILYEKLQKHKPDYILYRDKLNVDYADEAKKFVKTCLKFKNLKIFLHSDVELAHKLKVNGVHLTSREFEKIKRAKELDLEVIISAHIKEEVLLAQKEGAGYVTYSPIFLTPHKGKPKGIEYLKELLSVCKIKVFALGGIVNEQQVNEVTKTGVYGFASIRYFE